MTGSLYITGDEAADGLLNTDANALLIGMLLDQQVPMEWAFMGPSTLRTRLGHLDPVRIAAMDVDDFVAVCCDKPAIHRFPGSMGKRIHQVCIALVEDYEGDAGNIWRDAESGREIHRRLRALPGYGDEKSKIFVAILAKTQGVQPDDWRDAAGKFGDDVPRSVADIHDEASLAAVREWKKAQKAAKKDKQDNPIVDGPSAS
ncbi:MAG: HhH-GPD-type base excision DNA repair protein [Ilumatobacter sp.]|uniref:HhH-GPD-type base excision DNA repair protein n=1 Tax=Ilumatobacter sp. TaxID=1967498 RepID=UPI0032969F82